MALKKVEVEVSEGAHEVALALKTVVLSCKAALADGFQPGQDLPKVAGESFTVLFSALQKVGQLGPEASENTEAFVKAFLLSATDIASAFLKKDPAAPAA